MRSHVQEVGVPEVLVALVVVAEDTGGVHHHARRMQRARGLVVDEPAAGAEEHA